MKAILLGVIGLAGIGAVLIAVLSGGGNGGTNGAIASTGSAFRIVAATPTPDIQQALTQAYAALDMTDQQVATDILGAVANEQPVDDLYQKATSMEGRLPDLLNQQTQVFATERTLQISLARDGLYASPHLACSVDLASNVVLFQQNLGAQLMGRFVNAGPIGDKAPAFLAGEQSYTAAARMHLQDALLGRQPSSLDPQMASQAMMPLSHCSS